MKINILLIVNFFLMEYLNINIADLEEYLLYNLDKNSF